jgi:site-specific DNA-methyltransferase (adenine-specific)
MSLPAGAGRILTIFLRLLLRPSTSGTTLLAGAAHGGGCFAEHPEEINMNDLITTKVDKARALLAQARAQLGQVRNAQDAKKVKDVARAVEMYARQQRLSEEIILDATAIKVEAMTLLGEFLKANPPTGAGPGRGKKGEKKTNAQGELVSGLPPEIKPKESSDAQALADMKHDDPAMHEEVKAGKIPVGRAARISRRKKKKQAEAKVRKQKYEATHEANGHEEPSWNISHGDCLVELAKIQEGSVRLAFADPPYNIGVNYGGGKKADLLPREDYLAWCGSWMKAVARTLTPDGSFWVLINDESAARFEILLEEAGLVLRQWIIWYETFGVNHAGGFNRCHRHLFWFVKNPKRFVFHGEAVNRPSDRQTKYKDKRADEGGKTWDSVWGINPPIPRLTATCAERLEEFPTQLPLALLLPIVGCASEPGDLVLDPFAGSATTGVACHRRQRKFLGIEKSRKFADLSRDRLAAET